MNESKKSVPGVAIDEALELFLAAACPQGLPEGEERVRLLAALRKKVAADRPEWAAASPSPDSGDEPAPEAATPPGYSQVKAEIAEQAREPIPTAPEERFFYLRDKEAQAERERRKEEEREEQAREELRQKALARSEEVDEATMERALAIRQVLEERVRQLRLQPSSSQPRPRLTPGSPGPLELAGPATGGVHGLALAATSSEEVSGERGAGLDHGSVEIGPEAQGQEAALDVRDFDRDELDRDEKIESLRRFHQARRERLRSREEVLESRRPELRGGRRESLSLDDEKVALSTGLELEEELELTSPTSRRTGLSLS